MQKTAAKWPLIFQFFFKNKIEKCVPTFAKVQYQLMAVDDNFPADGLLHEEAEIEVSLDLVEARPVLCDLSICCTYPFSDFVFVNRGIRRLLSACVILRVAFP